MSKQRENDRLYPRACEATLGNKLPRLWLTGCADCGQAGFATSSPTHWEFWCMACGSSFGAEYWHRKGTTSEAENV